MILFGIPADKDAVGSDATQRLGHRAQAIRAAKEAAPELLVITDVCFCEYTDHGHCGVVNAKTGRLDVDNDATLALLGRQAVSHARAGADMVAPSGMMDGMVGAIRGALDAAGFAHVPIMSYAAKYASAFYGPFREAAESTPAVRRPPQLSDGSGGGGRAGAARSRTRSGRRGRHRHGQAGPGLSRHHPAGARPFPGVPLAAYNVSGEFSMVKAAAANGWLDEQRIALEMLTAIHRAGASIILTYWAKDVARWLGA